MNNSHPQVNHSLLSNTVILNYNTKEKLNKGVLV